MVTTKTGPRRRRAPIGPAAELAREFRERRMALRLTQQSIADLADVGRSTVLDLESGRGTTSLAAAVAVAEVLGMSLTLTPRSPGTDHAR